MGLGNIGGAGPLRAPEVPVLKAPFVLTEGAKETWCVRLLEGVFEVGRIIAFCDVSMDVL